MIICCGEALIDMLPIEISSQKETAYQPVSGGAIFNTAIALGRLGIKTGYCGGISTDLFGEQICQSLAESNVDYSFSYRQTAPTTLSFVKFKDGQASYAFYDENTAGKLFQRNNIKEVPADVEAFHFGAISLIQEPCGTVFEDLVTSAKESCVLSFDPNIRTSFITDSDGYRQRIHRLLSISDIIKVSDEDLSWLSPETKPKDFARQQLQRGASIVLFTEGSQGATAYSKNSTLKLRSKKVEVKDTIGAGDSFNAGFLSSLSEQALLSKSCLRDLTEQQLSIALDKANRVAAFTVTQNGAVPPWTEELSSIAYIN
ncbi:carbohydrate kinase [Kiloniella sp. EL199]|uniref:carbohydrate kinase family protein n=1 Tax=Kiloniella sp. EL199 TaxID=2107581 RepID=UPI000EA19929|nr:carbohydrate kinase [Kiloniella sp. EL199]